MRPLAEPDGRGDRGILEPAQLVDPGAGSVDDRPRRDRDGRPVDEHLGPGETPALGSQLAHLRVVEDRRPGVRGRPDVGEAETAVVRDRVRIEAARAQVVEAQARDVLPCAPGRDEPVQPCARERGVEDETGLHRQPAVGPVPVEREQEGQAADEMRRDNMHQNPALVMGLAYKANVAEPQVAEAAVDQLRGGARGPRAEVPAIDERNGEAGARRLGRDSRPDDPASDHEQVERPLPEAFARRLAAELKGHSGFVQAFRPKHRRAQAVRRGSRARVSRQPHAAILTRATSLPSEPIYPEGRRSKTLPAGEGTASAGLAWSSLVALGPEVGR